MTPRGPKVASAHLLLARVMQDMENVDKPNYVFAIADQLNRGKLLIDLHDDRLNCAKGNLRAAKQALGRSAFELASEYAHHGLGVVNTPVKWSESNYSTILDLHCVAAEALYCRGNLDESNNHLEEVFEHAESLADVTRARVIRVHALGAHARLEEAIDVAFCGARAAGVKLPKKPTLRVAILSPPPDQNNAAWQVGRAALDSTHSRTRGDEGRCLSSEGGSTLRIGIHENPTYDSSNHDSDPAFSQGEESRFVILSVW